MLALNINLGQVEVAIIFPPEDRKKDVVHGSIYGLPNSAGWIKKKFYAFPKKCLKGITASNGYLTHLYTIRMDATHVQALRKDIVEPVKGLLGPPPKVTGGATVGGTTSNSHKTRQGHHWHRDTTS
jgi:hypothetical protein